MPKQARHLLVGSTESYSGKSAIILGLAFQLQTRGIKIAYGKPLGTCPSEQPDDKLDEDVRFITESLKLPADRVRPTLLMLDEATIQQRLSAYKQFDDSNGLAPYCQSSGEDLLLVEGPGNLKEGILFNLALPQLADAVEAAVLIVARFHSAHIIDSLLSVKQQLGDRLLGVIINDVPADRMQYITDDLKPFLEQQAIAVLGIMPRTALMRSISVEELVHRLGAEVLCCKNRLDLMVESLTIGAMNVSSALKYFRKAVNMAVVTGGDRTDIQLAALETSTQCLILTGHLPPASQVLNRATDLEIPILSVDLDTLTTVEIIDQTFGQVRFHEPVKVECMQHLMEQHFDLDRLMAALNLQPVTTAS
ncbi:MAG: phosphotransacetylase family protein [Leptolyngbyaceae cyanobacterium SM1_1_3]|nr:phosphotransacetylase family protein [Leptolyngbyaceae cyanobacterium SM1_1_3]NJO09161.1 phosphotransacetylase family protein [Leptolyngbyaceae cyanobacterium SL_1_1]